MKHFAGDVTYSVEGWLEKNNDKLSEDYEKTLIGSSRPFVASLGVKPDDDAGGRLQRGGARERGVEAAAVRGWRCG